METETQIDKANLKNEIEKANKKIPNQGSEISKHLIFFDKIFEQNRGLLNNFTNL